MSFEYGLSSALNAVGFIHTLKEVLYQIGLNIPASIFSYDIAGFVRINPLACLLVFALTLIMLKGIKESIFVNNILTVSILGFFAYCNVLGLVIFDGSVATPFFKGGAQGVMRGAALCFYGYTSFEQPITVSEEAINPRKDLPKSLTAQIVIETVQYSILAYLVSGFIPTNQIHESTMIPNALLTLGYSSHAYVILIGTLIGMVPSILDSLIVSRHKPSLTRLL